MTYRLAVFDYDGTLADSQRAITAAMAAAVRTVAGVDIRQAPISDWIGLPLPDMVGWMVQERLVEASAAAAVVTAFRAVYPGLCTQHTRLYDGMREVLDAARAAGRMLAIATNKSDLGLNNSMRSLHITEVFHTVRTADRVTHVKPHPEMLLSILEELQVSPHEAVMIGDTIYDMEMGLRAQVPTVAVTYGMHTRERLQALQPTYMVARPRELLSILAIA